jgi:hypothetical protein
LLHQVYRRGRKAGIRLAPTQFGGMQNVRVAGDAIKKLNLQFARESRSGQLRIRKGFGSCVAVV